MALDRRITLAVAATIVVVGAAAVTVRYGMKRGWFRDRPTDTARLAWEETRDASRFEAETGASASDANAYAAWRYKKLDESVRRSMTPFLGDRHLDDNRKRVESLRPDSPPAEVFEAKLALGDSYVVHGPASEAVPLYDACLAMAEQSKDPAKVLQVLQKRATAHMRVAERANCVGHHTSASCIFPIGEAAVHVEKGGAEAAVKDLEAVLKLDPTDHGAMWLLNIAHMTLGTYPDGVAPQFRIGPEAFASEYEVPQFREIAASLGLNVFSRAGGSIMDDFNGDGFLDILVSAMGSEEGLHLFQSNGDGTFAEVSEKRGVSGQLGGLQIIHGDVNNDGRLDVMVLRGGWLREYGDMPNSLLVQDAEGVFRDVTEQAGVEVVAPTQTAAFADIDNDGDLDLYMGHECDRDHPFMDEFDGNLFRNRGDGTFEDITASAGVANHGYAKGVSFGDFDGDRLQDLYISNFKDPNRLYRNNGDGTFTDVAQTLKVDKPGKGFATWFFDYNNDGWPDIFATYYKVMDARREIGAYYKEGRLTADTARLFENDGRGRFREVTAERRVNRAFYPMGASFGDIDNDGFQDIYLATGDPEFASLWPNIMLRNDGGRAFQDVTTSSGTGHLQKGHGVSFGDLDNDGDQDLYVDLGGAFRDDAFWGALFENPGNANHWLTVRLVGRKSNRFGIGARVRALIEEPGGKRDVYYFGGGNGSFGGNSYQIELGLGQATRLELLEVFWPTTGETQRFTDVPLDRIVRIVEGEAAVETIDQKALRLGSQP